MVDVLVPKDRLHIYPAHSRGQAPVKLSPNLGEVDYSKYPPVVNVKPLSNEEKEERDRLLGELDKDKMDVGE